MADIDIDSYRAEHDRLTASRDRAMEALDAIRVAAGWDDSAWVEWLVSRNLPVPYELARTVTMIGQGPDLAGDVRRLTAEIERLKNACQLLGQTVEHMGRVIMAAHIEACLGNLDQAGEFLCQWVENVPELEWNGTETGAEWLERTESDGSATAPESAPASPEDADVTSETENGSPSVQEAHRCPDGVHDCPLNAGRPAVWVESSGLGRAVCAVPDPEPAFPGERCGYPIETVPCPEHRPADWSAE